MIPGWVGVGARSQGWLACERPQSPALRRQVHYVRSGDFVVALLDEASDLNKARDGEGSRIDRESPLGADRSCG
jgi:hypothetical protein